MERFIIGIDEVGRGALAGPVAVSAVCIPRKLRIRNQELGALKDSKKLTARQRERWAGYIKNHPGISYAIARVYPRGVDGMNIASAANLAALRAFRKLITNRQALITKCKVILDGGLYLGNNSPRLSLPAGRQARPSRRLSARTIVRGDEKFAAVKLASIVAKVSRDRYMVKLHKKYPQYGFAIHKGYGTKRHFAALRRHGPSEVHRLSFLRTLLAAQRA
ncbi:MAG: ribonuclease HII [Candidatus Liptonbacteria bacterium]|nr:ribonuclease HII [Candidatus Liptonbacteria bacterium]